MSDALSAMGLSLDEVMEADSELRTRPATRDGRICICGHSMTKHKFDKFIGVHTCKPSKMDCPCKAPRPVLEAEDTRPFLRRTQGSGAMHALSRGLAALITSGKSAEWTIDMICDGCKDPSDSLVPVPVTKDGIAKSEATGYDMLLCPDCRERA